MDASKAVFLWTSAKDDLFRGPGFPFHGDVMVTTIPEPEWARAHPSSRGACDEDWNSATDAERLKLGEELARQMIDEDKIPRNRVKQVFAAVDQFKALSEKL